MTQRTRAENIITKRELPPEKDMDDLQDIVGEAQNGPPQGSADGSINENAWYALRDHVDAVRSARRLRKTFLEDLG